MVKAVPALRHLRRTYGSAHITVVGDEGSLELVHKSPYVDRVLTSIQFHAEAELSPRQKVDIAIDLADPSERFANPNEIDIANINASTRVAYRNPESAPTLTIHPVWPIRLGNAARMLRLVWLLGGPSPDDNLSLWPTLAERNAAAQLLMGINGPLAVIHVGGTDKRRRWSPSGFARVVESVAAIGLVPVIVGTPADRSSSAQVSRLANVSVLDLTGRTSVGELVGVLERASLFVGGDAGPGVLARVLGIHSIIVAPGDWMEQFGVSGKVDHVTTADADDEMLATGVLPSAIDVPIEGVLAAVDVASRIARANWNAHQLPDELT
jgi:ADP-heptose:LPS heptosyltransferase